MTVSLHSGDGGGDQTGPHTFKKAADPRPVANRADVERQPPRGVPAVDEPWNRTADAEAACDVVGSPQRENGKRDFRSGQRTGGSTHGAIATCRDEDLRGRLERAVEVCAFLDHAIDGVTGLLERAYERLERYAVTSPCVVQKGNTHWHIWTSAPEPTLRDLCRS